MESELSCGASRLHVNIIGLFDNLKLTIFTIIVHY